MVFAFSKYWNIVFLYYGGIFALLYKLQVYRVGLVCKRETKVRECHTTLMCHNPTCICNTIIMCQNAKCTCYTFIIYHNAVRLCNTCIMCHNAICVCNACNPLPIGKVHAPVALSSSNSVDIIGRSFCLHSSLDMKPVSSCNTIQ